MVRRVVTLGSGRKQNSDSQSDVQNTNNQLAKVTPLPSTPIEPLPKGTSKEQLNRSLSEIDEGNLEGIVVPPLEEKTAKDFLNRFLLNDEGSAISQINLGRAIE